MRWIWLLALALATPVEAQVSREQFQMVSANVAAPDHQVYGGNYVFAQTCSAYGTVAVLVRGPDNATFMTLASYTAADTSAGHLLSLGSNSVVRVTITGTTGCDATLTRIPS